MKLEIKYLLQHFYAFTPINVLDNACKLISQFAAVCSSLFALVTIPLKFSRKNKRAGTTLNKTAGAPETSGNTPDTNFYQG